MIWNDNLTAERPTYVTHLECSMTGERYEADRLHGLSSVGRPLPRKARMMDRHRWIDLLFFIRSPDKHIDH